MELLKDVVAERKRQLHQDLRNERYDTYPWQPDLMNYDVEERGGIMVFVNDDGAIYWRYHARDPETLGQYQEATMGHNSAFFAETSEIRMWLDAGREFHHVRRGC